MKLLAKLVIAIGLLAVAGLASTAPTVALETVTYQVEQPVAETALAWNIAYDFTGKAEVLGSYTAYEIKDFDFLGIKQTDRLTAQIWVFAGASAKEGQNDASFIGGLAAVLHVKAGSNLYLNGGPKFTMDGERVTTSIFLGFQLTR